jgi:hypothetical protein
LRSACTVGTGPSPRGHQDANPAYRRHGTDHPKLTKVIAQLIPLALRNVKRWIARQMRLRFGPSAGNAAVVFSDRGALCPIGGVMHGTVHVRHGRLGCYQQFNDFSFVLSQRFDDRGRWLGGSLKTKRPSSPSMTVTPALTAARSAAAGRLTIQSSSWVSWRWAMLRAASAGRNLASAVLPCHRGAFGMTAMQMFRLVEASGSVRTHLRSPQGGSFADPGGC